MQTSRRCSEFTIGLLSLGLLAGVALAASPAHAQTTSVGPYYAMPSWDQTLPAATRFIILSNFASAAVLDRNTGLVWEKSPQTATTIWLDARLACINKNVGGQKGWRLPSIPELASLTLPPAHPFLNVQSGGYWLASTLADTPTRAWLVFFSGIDLVVNFDFKILNYHAWCVRGGMNADAY